jgi:phosphatidylglycerophosphatase C
MNLALFDFDGTITSSDSWTPFMRMAVRPARIRMAMVALSPVVVGYRLGMISASRCRQVAARLGFSGEPAAWRSVRSDRPAGHASDACPRAD